MFRLINKAFNINMVFDPSSEDDIKKLIHQIKNPYTLILQAQSFCRGSSSIQIISIGLRLAEVAYSSKPTDITICSDYAAILAAYGTEEKEFLKAIDLANKLPQLKGFNKKFEAIYHVTSAEAYRQLKNLPLAKKHLKEAETLCDHIEDKSQLDMLRRELADLQYGKDTEKKRTENKRAKERYKRSKAKREAPSVATVPSLHSEQKEESKEEVKKDHVAAAPAAAAAIVAPAVVAALATTAQMKFFVVNRFDEKDRERYRQIDLHHQSELNMALPGFRKEKARLLEANKNARSVKIGLFDLLLKTFNEEEKPECPIATPAAAK